MCDHRKRALGNAFFIAEELMAKHGEERPRRQHGGGHGIAKLPVPELGRAAHPFEARSGWRGTEGAKPESRAHGHHHGNHQDDC